MLTRSIPSQRQRGRWRAECGFTLLETLIAALLIVLAVSLLMTALVQINRIQGRIADLVERRTHTDLGLLWWRELIAGIHPAGVANPGAFRGEARRFSGISIAGPTAQAPGRALPFSLSVIDEPGAGEAVLRYAAGGRQIELLRLPADRVLFAYLDGDGGVHDEWPPRSVEAPEVPVAVRMTVEREGRRRMLFAASGGPTRTLPSAGAFFDLMTNPPAPSP